MVNMYSNLEKSKQVRQKKDDLNKQELQILADKLKAIQEQISEKCNMDEVSSLKAQINELKLENAQFETEIESLRDNSVSKDELKENLDEVSLCFNEFLNLTPRGGPDHSNEIEELKADLIKIREELKQVQSIKHKVNIVSSSNVDDSSIKPVHQRVPELELSDSKSLFKKPVKKPKEEK